jgi:hypothetical protein
MKPINVYSYKMIRVDKLKQLETKAQELDLREKGVSVIKRKYSSGEVYDYCGNCEIAVCMDEVYCPTCGTKLLRDEVNQC